MAFDWFVLRNDEEPAFSFRCSTCGDVHRGSPSFGYDRPHYYYEIPEAERGHRISIDDDVCAIDGSLFLIRTILEIPIVDVDEPFTWGVWVSQSQASFERYLGTFDQDQTGMSSFGWLPVILPGYDTAADGSQMLACEVVWGSKGQRPSLRLQPSDHLLYEDQQYGITWTRAVALARETMHGT